MNRSRFCRGSMSGWALVATALLVVGPPHVLLAQPTQSERARRLERMRQIVEPYRLLRNEGDRRTKVDLVKEPVLRFAEASRAHHDGTIWIWGPTGRPAALLKLYKTYQGEDLWVIAASSLSPGRVTLEGTSGWQWVPTSGIEFQDLPQAPVPADKETPRLRQMKELAQRLSGHEFWDPNHQRYELRLLPQPVHRYSDPKGGLIDGTLFFLCHDNNPEVAVLIEAVQRGEKPVWQMALQRMGHAQFHVHFDGREVWVRRRVESTAAEEAYHLVVETIPDPGVKREKP